jgi:hypothetical protein
LRTHSTTTTRSSQSSSCPPLVVFACRICVFLWM